jgi:SET domain-containing protein
LNQNVIVRRSHIAGRGVFARRDIPSGTRVLEYTGARITHDEADERYPDDDAADGNHHTFLFAVDDRLVIDATTGGNESRFINHSCDPNCEIVVLRRRVFIDTVRDIAKGDELLYDYWYMTDESYTLADLRRIYPCRCGSPDCRGTLARPPTRKPPRAKRAAAKRPATKSRSAKKR